MNKHKIFTGSSVLWKEFRFYIGYHITKGLRFGIFPLGVARFSKDYPHGKTFIEYSSILKLYLYYDEIKSPLDKEPANEET